MKAYQIFTKRGKPVADTSGRLIIFTRKRDAVYHCNSTHPGRKWEQVDIQKDVLPKHDITEQDAKFKTPLVRIEANFDYSRGSDYDYLTKDERNRRSRGGFPKPTY